MSKIKVTVYSDFICPFCYIGYLRLEKLKAQYDLQLDWQFMEIHPNNPEEGMPLTELGYSPDHWEMLMQNLAKMAKIEGVELAKRTFTTNSRRSLKLAYAVQDSQPELFDALNTAIYEAYFLRQINIGKEDNLRRIALDIGVSEETLQMAWNDEKYDEHLRAVLVSAHRQNIHGTPAYIFGNEVYAGAIPLSMMQDAANRCVTN